MRVNSASVLAEGRVVGEIGVGFLVYLGVARDDLRADADWMAEKLANLRILPDEAGAMNRSLSEEGLPLLLVSQFTLLADARRGRRPSFSEAAEPDLALELYDYLASELRQGRGLRVETGLFRAHMQVLSCNEGPVTILLDSKKAF